MNSPWTEERTATARKLWDDGWSATEISKHLATHCGISVSRNAVIGKLHRMDAPPHPKPPPRPKPGISATTHRAGSRNKGNGGGLAAKLRNQAGWRSRDTSQVKPPRIVAEPPPAPVEPFMVKLMDLENGQCRFPIGDPRNSDFGFCGHATAGPLSYCRYHATLTYQPAQDRQVRQKQAERALARFV